MFLLSYRTTYLPMLKQEDIDNGYDCVGVVIGKHYGWIDNGIYHESSNELFSKYHMFSEMMIGVR